MEIGNLIFGISRGAHAVRRDPAWQEAIYRLSELIDPAVEIAAFENDVFALRPSYWGDCDCASGEAIARQYADKHAEDCAHLELERARSAIDARFSQFNLSPFNFAASHSSPLADACGRMIGSLIEFKRDEKSAALWREREGMRQEAESAIRASRGLPNKYERPGLCTCQKEEADEKFASEHPCLETCSTVLPNFHHRASDYRLKWYKYPLRDSYANREVSTEQFTAMIDQCAASLRPVAGDRS